MKRTPGACVLLLFVCGCGSGKEAAQADVKRIYLSYAKAVHAGELEKVLPFRSGVTKSDARPSADQAALALGLLQINVPKDAQVTGASVEGDDAALIVKGTGMDGKPMEVWVQMSRREGTWKIVKETISLQAR